MGFITNNERYNQIIDLWTKADNQITDSLMTEIAEHKQGFNSVYMMLHSGARGSKQQIKQLCGLRGLMAKPRKNQVIQEVRLLKTQFFQISVKDLSVLEYFISTHGARKGLADTALKTADAGYLTRRLVDVAQDVVINEVDCGTLRGIETSALKENDKIIQELAGRIQGRYNLEEIIDPRNGELLAAPDTYLVPDLAEKIQNAGIEEVQIRSVLTCEAKQGVCQRCYGKNMASNREAELGDAVGIIAAQSIGEPGTQLTLRTFHVGGTASHAAAESTLEAKFDGFVEFDSVRTTKSKNDAR